MIKSDSGDSIGGLEGGAVKTIDIQAVINKIKRVEIDPQLCKHSFLLFKPVSTEVVVGKSMKKINEAEFKKSEAAKRRESLDLSINYAQPGFPST